MLKEPLQCLLGLNAASFLRGARLGAGEFVKSGSAAFAAVHPMQNRADLHARRTVKSIPAVQLEEILGSRKIPISLTVQAYEDGILPYNEAMALLSILVMEQPGEVLEIGTFMGHTTKAMAGNLPQATIHTVDLPVDFAPGSEEANVPPKDDVHLIKKRVVGREFKGTPVECRIRQHFGDTAVLDFREFGRPTFFFIDGAHTYDYCKQDSEKCLAACGGSGTFLWHDVDAGHPGVLDFVLEWRRLGRNVVRIDGTALAYWKAAVPARAAT